MSAPPVAAPAQSRAAAALGALLVLVAACAGVGWLLAVRLTLAGGHAHQVQVAARSFGIGDDVPTSFGFLAVEHAETLKGLSAGQLGGAVHGIGTFVGRDKAMVQASVTITNTTLQPVRYDPRQFRLVARPPEAPSGKAAPVASPSRGVAPGGAARSGKARGAPAAPVRPAGVGPAHASIRPGVLQPDAAIDARLSFVVPRDGARLALTFDDRGGWGGRGGRAPIMIDLRRRSGRVTAAEQRELRSAHGAGHSHDGGGNGG